MYGQLLLELSLILFMKGVIPDSVCMGGFFRSLFSYCYARSTDSSYASIVVCKVVNFGCAMLARAAGTPSN